MWIAQGKTKLRTSDEETCNLLNVSNQSNALSEKKLLVSDDDSHIPVTLIDTSSPRNIDNDNDSTPLSIKFFE